MRNSSLPWELHFRSMRTWSLPWGSKSTCKQNMKPGYYCLTSPANVSTSLQLIIKWTIYTHFILQGHVIYFGPTTEYVFTFQIVHCYGGRTEHCDRFVVQFIIYYIDEIFFRKRSLHTCWHWYSVSPLSHCRKWQLILNYTQTMKICQGVPYNIMFFFFMENWYLSLINTKYVDGAVKLCLNKIKINLHNSNGKTQKG